MRTSRDLFFILIAGALFVLANCSENKSPKAPDVSSHISLAAKLADKGLNDEAAAEYEAAMRCPDLSPQKRSNLCYLVANLYFDKKRDYKKALAYYVRAKHYNPQSPVLQKITQRTVTCLERIGRSLDAQNVLSNATYLAGEETRHFPGKVVAQIGDRKITMGELDNEIQKLSSEEQKRYLNDDASKLKFLRQYVGNELMYQTAKRAGYDKDEKLRQRLDDFEKMLMIQKLYKNRVSDKVKITPEEVQLYFKTHKDEFLKSKTKKGAQGTTRTKALSEPEIFQKNAQRIVAKLHAEKARKLEQNLTEQLMRSENVIIFEGEFGESKK